MRHFFFALLVIAMFGCGALVTYFFFPSETKTTVYTLTVPETLSAGEEVLNYGPSAKLSDKKFFDETKESFVSSKASFVEANLTDMYVRVYRDGDVVKEVPIQTKGKNGLWWQTPAGLYKIESKEKTHFSSIGHVYQPWSMAFQGNFFIHGWPHYEDGTPVATQFSGGCVRLTDNDAKLVFDLVSVGEPVLVYEKSFTGDGFVYVPKEPEVSASSYLVADIKNNHVFYEKGASTSASIASVTKLVTALVATEYINLDKDLTVHESDLASTSVKRLKVGEKVSAYSLLYPLLLESSNEASEVLASYLGRGRFISLMNAKAKSIGMRNTQFTDPSGREAGDMSTPLDLFALLKYLYLNRSFLLKLSSETLPPSAYKNSFSSLANFNLFKGDPSFVGGKIGKSTSAKETYVGIFELDLQGEKRPIAIIVLGSSDVKKDVETLRSLVTDEYRAMVTSSPLVSSSTLGL